MKKLLLEFKEFLKEYKVFALAIAFIMGLAANTLVKSLVDNIIMPFITPLIPESSWRVAVLTLGPVKLVWGQFLADVIYFVVVALVIFLVAKYVLREEKVTKK